MGGHEGGAHVIGLVSLQGEDDTLEHFLPLPYEGSEKVAICKPGREPSQGLTLSASSSWTVHLQNCEKINTGCLSHPHMVFCSDSQS